MKTRLQAFAFLPSLIGMILLLSVLSCARDDSASRGPRPKNIVLMIGDGMGVAQIYAGMTASGGHLNLEKCTYVGFQKTHSASSYITDSGASATAISTGKKTLMGKN